MTWINEAKLRRLWDGPKSSAQIADELKCTRVAVFQSVKRLGLPSRAHFKGRAAKPITIRGVTYESQTAAAKALGLSHAAICAAKKEGRLDDVGTGRRRPHKGMAVDVDGKVYPSMKAAARESGLSVDQVRILADSQREAAE